MLQEVNIKFELHFLTHCLLLPNAHIELEHKHSLLLPNRWFHHWIHSSKHHNQWYSVNKQDLINGFLLSLPLAGNIINIFSASFLFLHDKVDAQRGKRDEFIYFWLETKIYDMRNDQFLIFCTYYRTCSYCFQVKPWIK